MSLFPPKRARKEVNVEDLISQLTDEEIREHIEEFESHPADIIRAQAKRDAKITQFEEDMKFFSSLSKNGKGVLSKQIDDQLFPSRRSAPDDQRNVLRLLYDEENFLSVINDLGKIELTNEDRNIIRLVMIKVLTDLYEVVNPTKVNEVPKLIIKYEKGYGTSTVQLTADCDDKNFKKVGWYTMFETLWEKYQDMIHEHKEKAYNNHQSFQLLKQSLLKNNKPSIITNRIKLFLEDIVFFEYIDCNNITKIRYVFTLFTTYPNLFDVNFTRNRGSSVLTPDGPNKYYDGITVLNKAISVGLEEIIDIFLRRGCSIIDLDVNGSDIMIIAAAHGHVHLLKKFLEKYPDHLNYQNNHQDTPLHYAVRAGELKAIQFLLSNGADRNIVNTNGRTPLQEIEENNFLSLDADQRSKVKTLLTLTDVSVVDIESSKNDDESIGDEDDERFYRNNEDRMYIRR